jgi:hypothetical protein
MRQTLANACDLKSQLAAVYEICRPLPPMSGCAGQVLLAIMSVCSIAAKIGCSGKACGTECASANATQGFGTA